MKIAELFRRDVHRTIEEVIKVDLGDDLVISSELDEYVATEHIIDEFEKVLDAYQESILNPNEGCTAWISGFFGSGKSSWAKILGYLLWNPNVGGRSAAARFSGRTHAPRIEALLNSIHSQAPTLSVLLNLATGSNVVAREGESVVLPVYRSLLERLGYSRNFLLAELEFTLEGDGRLDEFITTFQSVVGKQWMERRYTSLAKNEASRALHAIDPATFPSPDSWARAASEPDIDADWFSARALELLERRGGGATRLVMIVDEAGQYVARSVQRMLDLQGLAEAFQKRTGRLWLVVTSQERLNDVVDSLESKQVELARAQSRFPLRVDLLPSDIEEVTGKRILDKTDVGRQAVRDVMATHRHQFATNTRLGSPTRARDVGEDEFVRLYPLLPYQIQLLIDAVSARRAQYGSSPTIGGSNRTLIKHAQQLIAHPQHGLGGDEVGALVTMDRSYDLLEELIPTSWRSEVDQVAEKYGAASVEARVMKVVALCFEVPALPLDASNIAVLLHSNIEGESLRDGVTDALNRLVADDRLREAENGFRLQSPEQKDWEQARRAIDLTQGSSMRLRRQLIRQALSGLSVISGRTFRVEVSVDGDKVTDGDLPFHIDDVDEGRREELRAASREKALENRITWGYQLSSESWAALVELHRSRTMIERRDTPTKGSAEVELLGEERERERRHEGVALQSLARDLAQGQVIFRGRVDDVDGTELRPTAQRLVADRLEEIYPELERFNASLRRDDVISVLRTADLGALPDSLRDDGIGLVHATPAGHELVADSGPMATLVAEVRTRAKYGQEATGAYLENHFAAPPYGASVEVIQAICAGALRAGLVEVIHQGQPISSPRDGRLDQVFGTLPRFRAAAFRPPHEADAPLERRVELAQRIEDLTGQAPAGHSTDVLAAAVRATLVPDREAAIRVESSLSGIGIPVPDTVARTRGLLDRLRSEDNGDVVSTANDAWADLVAGRTTILQLDELVSTRLDELQEAQRESRRSGAGLEADLAAEHAELSDLVAAGDLVTDFARITGISHRLASARRAAAESAATRLSEVLTGLQSRLRDEFADLDDGAIAEALRPLDALLPPEDPTAVDPGALVARIDSADARYDDARRQLSELRAAGRLAWVRVDEIVGEVITTEEELESALARLREAVAIELADGKQVRLQ